MKIWVTGGNDDAFEMGDILESSGVLRHAEGKVVQLDSQHEMISTGYSNITPWKCPRDIDEGELGEKIEKMCSQVKNMPRCIFNFHCPPHDTGIDTANQLAVRDGEIVPVMSGTEPKKIPVGSISVRKAIDTYQPLLGLHGHIHESRGICKLGRTLCINPGSEYSEGILRGVIVTVGEDKIEDYLLTSG
jgi:hypothetical protein